MGEESGAIRGLGRIWLAASQEDCRARLDEEMEKLAEETWSLADIDGDQMLDPLVFNSSGGSELVDAIVSGISSLQTSGEFLKVELQVEGDDWGFVTGIEPASYDRVNPGEQVSFTLNLFGASPASSDDQIFRLKRVVVGDGATSLATEQILLVVPGS